VESFRDGGQVHQRVLSPVGRLEALQASGQLEALLRSGLRFCQKLTVIDAHAAGQTEPVAVSRVGPFLAKIDQLLVENAENAIPAAINMRQATMTARLLHDSCHTCVDYGGGASRLRHQKISN
jgi:hypothetical protein